MTTFNVGTRAQKSLWQLLFIAVGFFGIQYAWAVQYSQMSTFLEKLGSNAMLTSLIWCAGPVTGTFTQPILAAFSDKTWAGKLGSRRIYLLIGAVICAVCMFLMPNAPNLLTAALLLWVWDMSINVCQGPIRWLVVDTVPQDQQPLTFSMMSFILALGGAVCFALGTIIPDIHTLFYFGGAAMLVTMGWTILNSTETKPAHLENLTPEQKRVSLAQIAKDTWHTLSTMHPEAKKLCWVNGLTWFGGQCMFVFFPLYVVHNVFGATDPNSPLYTLGRSHVSSAWLAYYVVCFIASILISRYSRLPMKAVHTVGLLCMSVALVAMYFITTPTAALILMGVAGVGWATTMSIPFSWAAKYAPEGKSGMHLGVFNVYIAGASVVANPISGYLVKTTGNDATALLLAGGVVLLSAILLQGVKEDTSDSIPADLAVA